MSNFVHMGKRAFGSLDHFLTTHGAKIPQFTEAAAPKLATRGGAYGATGAAILGAVGEGAGGYAAIRAQMG